MTEAAGHKQGRLSVASVGLDEGTLGRVMGVADEDGVSRSHAAGALASTGTAAMLAEAAGSDGALRDVKAAMADGTASRLTAGIVETRALPQVARDLGADPRWLAVLPQAQRRDMAVRIARAASTLARDGGTVRWGLVLSTARVMCRWSNPPWTLSAATRAKACQKVEQRISSLVAQVRQANSDDADAVAKDALAAADSADKDDAAELAWLSAWRLAAEVSDVPGAPPEGPLALIAAILAPRARGLVDEQTVQIRKEAGEKLAALLGIDADEARAVGGTAQSALQAIRLTDDAAVRDAALALAGYALRLAKPSESKDADEQGKAALALSQRGAREIVGYATAHPRAKLAALEAAGHVSHSTLQRRLVQLEAAGVMCNAGTQVRPLWQVAGVERDPEDELTERQQKVLSLMREEPPAKTPEIAREIGTSAATVFATYKELAALGLAEKSANRWVAAPRGDEEPAIAEEEADASAANDDAREAD